MLAVILRFMNAVLPAGTLRFSGYCSTIRMNDRLGIIKVFFLVKSIYTNTFKKHFNVCAFEFLKKSLFDLHFRCKFKNSKVLIKDFFGGMEQNRLNYDAYSVF